MFSREFKGQAWMVKSKKSITCPSCWGSERRNEELDDFNTLDCAFMGGEGRKTDLDICPLDQLTLNYIVDVSGL